MDPGRVPGKFLDEHGAHDGPSAFAGADVLNVGDAALDHLAVFVIQGKGPHFFAGHSGAGQELVREHLIGTKNSDVDVGERDYNRAGKRRGVDKVRAAKLFRIRDGVRQDQAALGVRVDHFNRLPGHRDLDVPGFLRPAAGHVLTGRHNGNHFARRLKPCNRPHRAEHGGAAAHVVLHLLHIIGGLNRNSAGIKCDRFADQAKNRSSRLQFLWRICDND